MTFNTYKQLRAANGTIRYYLNLKRNMLVGATNINTPDTGSLFPMLVVNYVEKYFNTVSLTRITLQYSVQSVRLLDPQDTANGVSIH